MGPKIPPRILLVEDSADDALLAQTKIRRVAREAYFERVETEEGMRRALQAREWDLVLCDHSLPRFDSRRALDVLRQCDADVPFVIYSGSVDESLAIQSMGLGAQDFVSKREPARLIPVVERELRNATFRREKQRAETSVVQLSRFDPLTRLPNRSSLVEILDARLAAGPPGALLAVDLDRFMRINDSFGYGVGDDLLRQVAARFQLAAGPGQCVARLSEDKFALLLSCAGDRASAMAVAKRISAAFIKPFSIGGHDLYVGFSAGLARIPDNAPDGPTLLKNAESAMGQAKRLGANRIVAYEPDITADAEHRLKLESALYGAVGRGEIEVLYQPIVELASGRVIATEALARWRHPQLGVIGPDQFIPLAEEIGVILDVGDWVLETACAQTRLWREAGNPSLRVAVNISPVQFHQGSIAEKIPVLLAHAGLPAEALELEITEGMAMSDLNAVARTLGSLRRRGVRVALDDFGTGFSSLAYLKRLPIDILKIDKSFVSSLPAADDDVAIVQTIVALGRALGLQVHGEGIETARQNDLLVKFGCTRGQGHAIAPALRACEVTDFIRDRTAPERLKVAS